MINKYKKKYNSNYPELVYKFIVFGHNEHEIENAKKLAKKLDMEMQFSQNCVQKYSPIKNSEKVYKLTGIKDANSKYDVYLENYKNGYPWFFCLDLFYYPSINFNGDLFGCCVLFDKSFKVNVFKQGLLEALNNQKVLYAKLMLTDLSTKRKYSDIPCNNCDYYKKLKKYNIPIRYNI